MLYVMPPSPSPTLPERDSRRWSPLRAWLLGGAVVGVLDLLDALIFFGLRGAKAVLVLQAIAAGLIGRETARSGGAVTVLIGLAVHFAIAFTIVGVYHLVAGRVTILARQPFIFGPLYGVAAYLVMNFVVLPLSATPPGSAPIPLPVLINGLLIHALGVGLPSALSARLAMVRETVAPR